MDKSHKMSKIVSEESEMGTSQKFKERGLEYP